MPPGSLRIFISHPSHFMTDCEPHGDGLLAYEYICRLAQRGHELHVSVPAMHLERPVPKSIHLYPMALWTHASRSAPSLPHRVEYAIRVRRLLGSLQRRLHFDLIHQLNPVVRGMSALLGDCGLPIVLGPLPAPPASPLDESMMQRLNRAVLHAQIRSSAMVLLPNMASLPLIPDDAESRAKVRELHFGVDTSVFHPMPQVGVEPQNVLFLANLVQKKGALFLLEAFEAIASRHPACRLRFAGSGEEEESLRERARRSPAADRIEFLGRISRERVAQVMNTATVYCLPSAVEAFGMTALEAMACGRPVIGTQVGGLGLLVGATSPEVRFGDRDALASALDGLLSSPEACVRLGEENRRIAVSEYDWERVIDRLEAYYRELEPQGEPGG
jgi:glycosyltransferase involved in cell wall biosynthesis